MFIPSHVLFISKSSSENSIKICKLLTKLKTRISWLLFTAHSVYKSISCHTNDTTPPSLHLFLLFLLHENGRTIKRRTWNDVCLGRRKSYWTFSARLRDAAPSIVSSKGWQKRKKMIFKNSPVFYKWMSFLSQRCHKFYTNLKTCNFYGRPM